MNYSIRVWLFTVLISPILLFLILGVFKNSTKFGEILESWPIIGFMMIYGLVLSIPAMLVFWIIERKLLENLSQKMTKLVLSIYSFISVWITFYIFDSEFVAKGLQQVFWVIVYSLTIVLGVWIFKLPNKSQKNVA